jgi:hypothetical protein
MKEVANKVSTDYCLCTDCSGRGTIDIRTSAYDTEYKDCATCGGKGRLKVVTTTKFYKIDK